ncbi:MULTISPECIES: Bug family tripartite tricarboxylate transporter substrate binding protein [Variovorax]|jgi:tripartite-type tricarboxylate transporter receptor subunit TctC|uniref:Bug family tripartite tricarboxylate transporter substrate binding protein n=1 Tax=Variovorax TaxID=34072 RepID=UPI00086851EA|nr:MULTISPECIES: tripartite tricarboxylate transporter substrate binding protein [Variovorax]MBN8751760.1 tripartite tricarboxylate transporter substrate binding protein [Variovorax sp.]ODU11372.1 MAG: LacI family transcriptional regulator [Variovorax sp. SCN 67-85]ODV15281.1 MAG: LacI family transcriptional regulator [Variovorax sp. SCN 67-20]OJZ06092.1 MAG: LacI family transcriptional regulator [Variovorax sp. 67-131]UKI05569.1 tripartite tricarboxylate transporter substrate binding protein 
MPAQTSNHRRALLSLALIAAVGGVALSQPGTAQAENAWPTKAITLVVPFPAGGTTDTMARLAGQALSKELGQSVVIDNKPGAGGNIGAQAVARSTPDGYTLLMGTVGTHAINPALYKKMPYNHLKDFAPVSRVVAVPNVLVVNPSRPYKTVQELIAYARANPDKVTYASSGNGTSIHLVAELFKTMTGVKMQHIPYKGSAPALADLMGGQTDIMFDNMPSSISFVKAGKLRPLAVTTATRSAQLPNVPVLAEAGVPGFDAASWFGLLAPAGTPAAVIQRIDDALIKAMASTELKQKIIEQGGDPVAETPEKFSAFIQSETVKWGKIVKDSGASVD